MKIYRVFVPMTEEERSALVDSAQKSMRDPQQQARFILRNVLLGDQLTKNADTRGAKLSTVSATGVGQ